jgi:4-hydroxy-tetrahydrodipicolinate synthase
MAHQLSGRLVRTYFDACRNGDTATADRLEPALFAIYRCFRAGSYYAGIKATMNALGIPVGGPREPLLPFSEAQTAKVQAILAEARVAEAIRSLA